MIFNNIKYRDGTFQRGPYFMNFVFLFMKPWIQTFNAYKEYFSSTFMWIPLYYIPQEFFERS